MNAKKLLCLSLLLVMLVGVFSFAIYANESETPSASTTDNGIVLPDLPIDGNEETPSDEEPSITIPDNVEGDSAVIEGIKNNTSISQYIPANLPEGATLEIVLKSAVGKIIFDVTPMANDEKVEPDAAITFALPVPAGWSASYVVVYHEGSFHALCGVQGSGNGKYVEITSENFSEYSIEEYDAVLPDGVTDASFGDNTVTDGTNYYKTMVDALLGIHLTDNRVLYCKPGADVGTMTHGHVCEDLTVYGNYAYVSGGEQDFEIDTYKFCHNGANACDGITANMTLTVNGLNGCGAWGQRTTSHTVNLVFENCEDMNRVYINGTSGVNNITLTNCSFLGTVENRCTLYSNANGSITLANVEFANVYAPINLNHKVAGAQVINISDCSFADCGYAGYDYAAPIRVLSSVEGATSALTVSGCTFSGTKANAQGQSADILLDYGVGETNATISSTAANVTVETEENVGTDSSVAVDVNADFTTSVPKGTVTPAFTSAVTIWGEATGNAKESFAIRLYAGDLLLVTATLNDPSHALIDGNIESVTWNIPLNSAGNDSWWIIAWENYITTSLKPTKVVAVVDGVEVATNEYRLNAPDDLSKIYAAVADEDGKILSYYTSVSSAGSSAVAGQTVQLLRDTDEAASLPMGVVLDTNGYIAAGVTVTQPVANINGVDYASLADAFAAAQEGDTIVLLEDATPALTSQRAITKAAVIDLGGNTLTLTEDDLYFGTTTFKNGTIVVDPSVKPSTAVFWMFANQTLTFDHVKLVATGVTGTYLIGLDGNNSDLNLLNGSEIVVENTTALDLDIICVNASTGNDIVIEDSKVNVTNLDGRVFFRGNYTVGGASDIQLEGITKAGFRIEAGQTLSIEDTASVVIVGEPRDGGIHLTDLSATYTVADSATVNAVVNKPVAVAEINGVEYASLQAAIDAVQEGETIVLLSNVTVTSPAYGQNALNHARAVGFTLDLGGYTLSADTGNSVFRFNIANSGATANVVVTVKNGTVIAGANTWCALMASGISADVKAIMNLEDLTVKGSKAGDLAVKAWSNSVIYAENVTVEATKGAGGFYAVGGEIVLNNCTVTQKGLHTAPYLSTAFAVSNNGKLTVNSGTYSSEPTAAEEGNNQGSTHGSWVGNVMSSGGTLIINGGTFSNGNYGEDSLATAARALLSVDAGGRLEIYGGNFNALNHIIYLINNKGDASLNPTAFVAGGIFSADPTAIDGYGAVELPENYMVVDNTDGTYTVAEAYVAINGKGYPSLKAAVEAAQNNDVIVIVKNIALDSTITIPAGVSIAIDLNGKTISGVCAANQGHMFMIANTATLTIKDSSATGKITYAGDNSTGWIIDVEGSLILESGTLELTGTWNIGYAVDVRPNAWGTAYTEATTFVMNGGSIVSSDGAVRVASSSHDGYTGVSASFVMNGGSIDAAWDGIFVQQSNAAWDVLSVTINGGTVASDLNPIRFYGPAPTSYVNGADCVDIALSGGTLTYTGSEPREWLVEGIIRLGGGVSANEAVKDTNIVASATFAAANVPADYKWVKNDGGKYELVAKTYVAQIGEAKYETIADALAAAQAGNEIVLLADVNGDLDLPANVILNGNGKQITGTLYLMGDVTLNGHVKANAFDFENVGTEINIPAGATLELTGTGRMIIGHGCTFNITGTITDAKTADKATLTPSLIMPGASFTGAGVTFNVTNAYITVPSFYCSSSKYASGNFVFNITNSIWESAGKLAFEEQSVNATVEFNLKDSVLTTGSHLVFGLSGGNVVIDNSNVNVGTSRQLENCGTMTIKNGSVVNGAVATSSNAKNPGTVIVDNATYAVTGEFSGSDLGTGTLIIKNGATVSAGSITNANIQIDANGMQAGDEINLTANLSNLAGTVEVVNNDKLEANIVDGKVVLKRTLSGEGTENDPYIIDNIDDLIFFRDSVNAGNNYAGKYVKLNANIDLSSVENWIPIGNITYDATGYVPVDASKAFSGVFDGNGKVISNLKMQKILGGSDPANAQANLGLFGVTGEGAVIKNLTITNVTIESDGRNVAALVGHAHKTVLDNITVNGNIQITGGHYVAGISGMSRTVISATNLAVIGDDGSAIVGKNIVGGITPEIAPAVQSQVFAVLTVKNVTISGVGGVGGIVGLLTNAPVSDVSVKDVALVGRTDWNGNSLGRIRLGIVAGLMGGKGPATVTNVTVNNVTAQNLDGESVILPIIGANYDSSSNATEARIGDKYYATVQAAIAAAQAGDVIELLTDVAVEGTLSLPANIAIKSNDHTINGSIRMLGDLELKDALTITGGLWVGKSDETLTATLFGGKLTASYFMFQYGNYTINADIDAVYGYLSYEGTFVVNSTIHTTGANGEVLYINGGVTLNDGAVLDSDNSVFLSNANAKLIMMPGSKVDSKLNFTASGAKLCIHVTGLTEGVFSGITGTVTNNGTIEVVNNDKLEANIVDGKVVLKRILPGEGTESNPYIINDLSDLIFFRDSVNAGNNYAGKYVKLNANIDLANENWTPIGTSDHPFCGMFDGQGNVISNLLIEGDKNYVSGAANDNYKGFFGYMKGGNTAGIKNLNIHNAKVTGCLYVGAILGRSYTGGIIDNCHVYGLVQIDGYSYIGGIVGRHEYSADANHIAISDCSVNGNVAVTVKARQFNANDSYINADYAVSYVGGIVGFMGEGKYIIDGCSVANVEVSGVYGVGGISGIGHYGNEITDASVSGVTVTSTGNDKESARTNNVGLIVGATQGTASEPTIIKDVAVQNTSASATYTDNTSKKITALYGSNINGSAPVTNYVAEVGGVQYENFADALAAAKAMTGDVVVKIFQKVTLNSNLSGNFDSIAFIGEGENAEIYLDVQGYITAPGKKVSFADLKLSKVYGAFMNNAGFMNVAFGIYDVAEVNCTNCVFLNGAYASSGEVTYTGCTFYRSHDKYGLWAYGNVDVTVDNCIFADYRGIKMYAEGAAKTVDLTVKNSDFSAVTDKPAIVLTYGQSVKLENNEYSATGVFELDLDGAPNGTAVESDVLPTCKNDNGACGVLVDGKIYTTVEQAVAASASGSRIDLLHDTTETVVLPAGVQFNANGFAAANVKAAVAQIGNVPYASLQDAIDAADAGDTITLLADLDLVDATVAAGKNIVIDLNGKTITDAYIVIESDVTIKNGSINNVNEPYPLVVQNGGNLVIDDVAIEASMSDRAIWVRSGSSLVFNSGSILATKGANNTKTNLIAAIYTDNNTDVTINGGTITVDTPNNKAVGIFGNYTNANVTVNGGKISTSGKNYSYGINVDGDIAVNGGEIVTNEKGYGYSSGIRYGNNYALVSATGDVTITGGTITTNGYSGYIVNVGRSYSSNDQTVTITGGTLANNLSEVEQTTGGHKAPVLIWEGSASEVTATITEGNISGFSPALLRGENTDLAVSGGTFDVAINEKYLAEGFKQKQNADGSYGVIVDPAYGKVAQIGDNYYETLADALAAAVDGDIITLLWKEGDAPIAMNGAVYGKTVTITGTATVDWAAGFLFVGRGGAGNGTVIFENANLTSASNSASAGIHVSGREKDTDNKYDGTLILKNSTIELDYLINKGAIKLEDSTLIVKNGFSLGGRPAIETETGEDATATVDLVRSTLVVNRHNGMGIGYEAIGILNVDADSTFKTTQDFLVTGKGTLNVNGGTLDIAGTFTNNGEVYLTNVDLTNVNIVGSGTTYFSGNINFYGANTVTSGINGSDFELIVNKGANLLISRFVLGYNRNITVYGDIADAHAFDPAGQTPSLKFNSTSGVSVGGTGTGNLTVKDAYVELGSSSWKNAYGTYTWSFENAYVSATSFTNNNPQSSASAQWTVTFDNSVLAAKNYIKNGVGTSYSFINGSVATTGSLRIDGELYIDATSSVTTTAQQNNVVGALDEHGGINGAVTVDGTLTIGSNAKTQLEMLGGSLTVGANGKVALGQNSLTLDADSNLTVDITGKTAGDAYDAIEGAVVSNGNVNAVNNDPSVGVKVDENGNIVIYSYSVKIGDAYYETLAEAVAAANAGDTIVLLGDVVLSETLVIPAGNSIILDLNGHDLVASINVIVNNGTLVINDSVGNGNVYTTDVSAQGRAAVVNYGTLTINAGWFGDANNDVTDRNAINRGNAVKNYGELTINGGYFTNVSNQYIANDAFAYAINTLSGGNTVINSATVYGDINGLIFSDGKTIVNGGSFTLGRPNEENNLWYLAYGDVEIKGGTWNRAFKVPSWNTGDPKFEGEVVVSGGKFNVSIPENNCAENFIPQENADGSYGVRELIIKEYEVGAGKAHATLNDAIAQAIADNVDIVTYKIYGAVTLETGYSHGIVDFAGTTVTVEGADDAAKLTIVGGGVPDIKGITMQNITFADEGAYLPTANEFMYQNFIDTKFVNVVFEDGIRLSGNCVLTNCTVNANTNNEYAIWMDEGNFVVTGTKVTAGNDAYGLLKSDTADTITLTGNTFEYLGKANKEALNTNGAKIIASGNTFIDCTAGIVPADKTNYAPDGSTSINDSMIKADNTVTVNVAKIGEVKYETIQDALDAAVPDDIVTILAGDYTMTLNVNKAITVVGEIDENGNNLVNIAGKLNITADGAAVKHLNINNGGSSAGYINAKDVLVEGCTVVGGNGFRYCYTTGLVTFKDSTITGSTYGIHFDGSEGGRIVIDNCVITGWTSFGSTIKSVTMTDTKFEEGNYNYVRFYQENIVIEGCTFNENMAVDIAISGAELDISNSTLENGNVEDLFDEADMVNSSITVDDVKLVRVARIGDNYYETLEEAFKAATDGCVIEILADVVIDYKWDCRDYATNGSHSQFRESVTINGNGHKITFKGTVNDNNWNTIFRFEENATVNNLTVDISAATGVQRIISAKKSLTVNGLTIIGSAKYGIIFGEGASADDLAATEIAITNSVLTGTSRAISDNEGAKDVKSIAITNNQLSANVYVSASDSVIFTGNTVDGGDVDIRSYAGNDTNLTVVAKDNTLDAERINNIIAKNVEAQSEFATKIVVSTWDELAAAIANVSVSHIVLANDITAEGRLVVDRDLSISLNGKNLYLTQTDNRVWKAATLTIDGNGVINVSAVNGGNVFYVGGAETGAGTQGHLVLNNIAVYGENYNTGTNAAVFMLYGPASSTLDINGCEINLKNNLGNGSVFYDTGTNNQCKINIVNSDLVFDGTVRGSVCGDITIDNSTVLIKNCDNGFNEATLTIKNGSDVTITDNTGRGITVNRNGYGIVIEDSTVTLANNGEGDIRYKSSANIQITNSEVALCNVVVDDGKAATINGNEVPNGAKVESVNGTVAIHKPVAKIGNVYYLTLADAFAAAQDGDTIVLLADIAMDAGITNTKKVTFDLNGKTITGTDNATGSFGLFTNRGELTITGNGTITLVANNNRGWNAYSSVISNTVGGKLIVENGTIEHFGGTDMAYAIDNLTNGKGTYAETVINGGYIKSTYRAIRQFLNGVEAENILTVNGGTIEGANKSIWMQDPSAKANTGSLTVGGNATINGNIYLTVTAGSTEWPVEVSINASALSGTSTVLTNNVPPQYTVGNVNGSWGRIDAVASVNGVGYATLAEALAAATEGSTVDLLTDVTLNGRVNVSKSITLNGNGHSISGNFGLYFTNGTYTIDNVVFENINYSGINGVLEFVYATANITNCTFKNNKADSCIAVDCNANNDGTSNVTVDACTFEGNECSVSVINVAEGTATVKDCAIIGNTANIALIYTSSDTVVSGCYFSGNNLTGTNANKAAVLAGPYRAGEFTVKMNGNAFNDDFLAVYVEDWSAEYGTNTAYDLDGNYWNGSKPNYGKSGDPVVALNTYYASADYTDGTLTLSDEVAIVYVAQIGNAKYETLQAAIDAATAGDVISFIEGLSESVTVKKSITIDGSNKNYTGTIAITGNVQVTVQNVKFVEGMITHSSGTSSGKLTVKNCTFQNGGYAIETRNIRSVTIENCQVFNQSLLYAARSTVTILVKDVTILGGNYGAHIAYGSKATFENVTMIDMKYGVYVQNYGAKTITLKNCDIRANNPINVWERNTTVVDTFKIEGTTRFVAPEGYVLSAQAKIVLVDENATLEAPANLAVTEGIEHPCYKVVYENGIYKVILEHTVVIDPAVAPDCENTGLTEGSHCSVCDEVFVAQQEVPATDHTWVEATVDAPKHCEVCGVTEGEALKAVASINGVKYPSIQAAVDAAQDGDTVVIESDVTLVWDGVTLVDNTYAAIVRVAGKSITIDLNGHTLTGDSDTWATKTVFAVFAADDGGELTLTGNGTVKVTGETAVYSLIMAYEGGTYITIENGNYYLETAKDSLLYAGGYENVMTVNGGNFELGNVGTSTNGSPWIINVYGQNYNYVVVNGGTFNSDICHQFWANEVFVDGQKYAVQKTGDATWKVVPAVAYVEEIGSSTNSQSRFVGYATLAEALNAAGEKGWTVTLLQDFVLDESIVITADQNIVIDLNGHTMSMADASGVGTYMIKNYGVLTIDDTVGGGKLTFNSTTPSANFGYSTSTIGNAGILTVVNGTIENTTNGGASYAIDNTWYTRDVALNIQGGNIVAEKTAVRQVPFSTTYKNELNITGGVITGGNAAVQTHHTSGTAYLATVKISGGELNGTYAYYTYYHHANTHANTDIQVTGGIFNGYLYIYNGNVGSSATDFAGVSVEGGTFNAPVYVYVNDAEGNTMYLPVISGGTFADDSAAVSCVEGFGIHANADGTYGVHEHVAGEAQQENYVAPQIGAEGSYDMVVRCTVCNEILSSEPFTIDALTAAASINDVKYSTIEEALAAAPANSTITLESNVTYNSSLLLTNNLTLDLNGYDFTVRGALVVLKGSYLIDSQSKEADNGIENLGKIYVDNKYSLIVSDEEYVRGTAMLPVWVPEDGSDKGYYVFVWVKDQVQGTVVEGGFNVMLRPSINNNSDLNKLILGDGAIDNGLYIEIYVHCYRGNDEVEILDFVLTNDYIKEIYGENEENKTYAIGLTVKNIDPNFADKYVVTYVVKSDRGISHTYEIGYYDAVNKEFIDAE